MSLDHIHDANRAVQAAQAILDRTIRDAHTAGATPTEIVAALGTRNRQRVYHILDRTPEPATEPPVQRVVYLRGRGAPDWQWAAVESAMWARGWRTIRDRNTAFHLARGGVPVVLADFTPTAGGGHASDEITVGAVRARYDTTPQTVQIRRLIGTAEDVRLTRAGATWLDTRVEIEGTEMELPLITGGRVPRPVGPDGVLDPERLAALVTGVWA